MARDKAGRVCKEQMKKASNTRLRGLDFTLKARDKYQGVYIESIFKTLLLKEHLYLQDVIIIVIISQMRKLRGSM